MLLTYKLLIDYIPLSCTRFSAIFSFLPFESFATSTPNAPFHLFVPELMRICSPPRKNKPKIPLTDHLLTHLKQVT